MDTSTAPTAINSRAVTPLMPEKEKEAGAAPPAQRLSRTDTLTVVSTHDSRNGGSSTNPITEKNGKNPMTSDVEVEAAAPAPADESTILTGRKLFLVFVYVVYPILY